MYISECMNKYFPKVAYKAIREKPVDSLGILVSECEKNLCSFIDDKKYLLDIASNIHMLFITKELFEMIESENIGYLIVENPRLIFFELHNALKGKQGYVRESFNSQIDSTAQISSLSVISPQNVKIGKNVEIEPFVTIYENTVIEENCIIRSGARIGGMGFEHKRNGDKIFSVEHFGGTIIQNDVEIQNNTCVDRAIYPWDNTVIGSYTKIGDLVYVGHGVKIGNSCMIPANTGIGGRTIVGKEVWIGFGSTIKNGISIGDKGRVNIGSVVTKDVLEGESVTGNFAIPHEKFLNDLKETLK